MICAAVEAQIAVDDESSLRQAPMRYFNIPAQSLGEALLSLSKQSDANIIGLAKSFDGLTSSPIDGNMRPLRALEKLPKLLRLNKISQIR